MHELSCLKFLNCMSTLVIIYFHEAESDEKAAGLGQSSCGYCGDMAVNFCGTKAVPLNDLPESCTSFVYHSITLTVDHQIIPAYLDPGCEYLNKLGKFSNMLYVNIGHNNYTEWTTILDCDGQSATKEAVAINAFTSAHPGIKGLLLRNLEPDLDSEEFIGYTQKLLKYIEVIKKYTGLEIAIMTYSVRFFDKMNEKQGVPYLNFTALDSCTDFYVFTLYSLYDKCDESIRYDMPPISGNGKYTLEKLEVFVENLKIPKNKIYFNFDLTATSPDEDATICDSSYEKMCLSPDTSKNWCSNTQEALFKKGQWFQQNGAGFVGSYVDFDDPNNCCNCGKYPTFNAILAGFNGTASVPKCPLYDRTT